jgi:hypothetical protein
MPINFPNSPTNNQTYSYGGRSWVYNSASGAWIIQTIGSTGFSSSNTAPVSPAVGDEWFNPDTGALYKYINDGDSDQWIELGPPGLQGVSGAQGVQGSTGSGAQGTIGSQGIQGTLGTQGALGVQGAGGVSLGLVIAIS